MNANLRLRLRTCKARGGLFAGFCLAVFLLGALMGCGKGDAPSRSSSVDATRPREFEIRGTIALGESDRAGVMIFCAGTSYLAFTNSDGSYALSGLPAGAYAVYAQKPGYQMSRIFDLDLRDETSPASGMELPLVELKPLDTPSNPFLWNVDSGGLAVVAGYVILSDNARPEGVRVQLKDTSYSALANINGAFSIAGIVPGDYTLEASHPGYQSSGAPIRVDAGRVNRLENQITLRPATGAAAGSMSVGVLGKVLFLDEEGRPLDSTQTALVGLLESDSTVETAADGSFEFQNLAPGAHTLVASSPGFLLNAPVRVELGAESVTTVLVMRREKVGEPEKGSIRGRILLQGARANGHGGIMVAVMGGSTTGATDAQGRFLLGNVDPGSVALVCSRQGHKTLEISGIEVVAGEVFEVDSIVMERDVEAPRVLSTDPADGARDVVIMPTVVLRVSFNKRMNIASVQGALSMSPACKFRVQRGRFSDADAGQSRDTLEILISNDDAARALRFNTNYTVTISDAALDADGIALESGHKFQFRTAGLRIIGTRPEDGAIGVSTRPTESRFVKFNGKVDPATLIARNIRARPDPVALPPVFTPLTDPTTGWTILPLPMTFNFDTRYTLTFDTGIQTPEGVRMDRSFDLEFQTEKQ